MTRFAADSLRHKSADRLCAFLFRVSRVIYGEALLFGAALAIDVGPIALPQPVPGSGKPSPIPV